MTEFLIRRFVRDYAHTENEKVRAAYGRFSGAVGLLTNLVLAAIKFAAGSLSGSLAITADAVNNLSDSASSIVTLVGFKLSEKPADEEHPFGHERFEYLSGLVVSFVILVVGLQLAQDAVSKILQPVVPVFSALSVGILALSILAKLWQSLFYRNIGRRIQSGTLFAAAADSRNDVIATGVILLGILITKFTGVNLDGFMGLAVAILVLLTGIKLVKETSDPLLGEAPSKELVDKIYNAVKAYDGILGAHDLTVHNYGPDRWFASVHCEVDARKDVLVSHDLIDNIERTVGPQLGIQLVIHMDPVITDDPRTNHLKLQVQKMVQAVEPKATIHDFRVVWGPTHSNLIFDVCAPFSCSLSDEEIAERIHQGVKALSENYYPVVTVDRDFVREEADTGEKE
ncbi:MULTISPECIES: cation diffusion facilitator family transporter [Caproicibacterium]|uniref:Cation diffusion facilitator family transporter n=1 Tax=Caproicibacterium argilliputei TaxID=3030016 RepID=A0AA97H0G4_9FIRM|nr:cation diffusion facilitator family transporter [Caproicibacterium argilliputei]WOC31501.1 cation diffusion facilitator family transporter [Caproicibacterium argilliputei]